MFARGSRYRFVSESPASDAGGNRAVGKELRLIPPAPGQFLHTVSSQDRLDLLSFRYYGDPTRWWQICDANPQFGFPPDLLDRDPLVEEVLVLVDAGNASRFADLMAALTAIAAVQITSNSFLEANVTVIRNAGARSQILAAASQRGFALLRSFTWTVAQGTAEAFTLDDPGLKKRWRAMLEGLRAAPGVTALQSRLAEATVHVIYNSAMIDRSVVLLKISQQGFAVSPLLSQQVGRTGARIIVPPNGSA
jgi:hypothetical protein